MMDMPERKDRKDVPAELLNERRNLLPLCLSIPLRLCRALLEVRFFLISIPSTSRVSHSRIIRVPSRPFLSCQLLVVAPSHELALRNLRSIHVWDGNRGVESDAIESRGIESATAVCVIGVGVAGELIEVHLLVPVPKLRIRLGI
jgi:hypothetical protein